jgi:hypothetical protein
MDFLKIRNVYEYINDKNSSTVGSMSVSISTLETQLQWKSNFFHGTVLYVAI